MVWVIAAIAIAGMLLRPWRVPEWIWAAGGAVVLVAAQLVTPGAARASVLRGLDVYGFLAGILALAEFARHERLFDYLAAWALRIAGGSQRRLFATVYLAGVAVTALLSNDTTIVVLTPAVMAALVRTDADPLPYLYACAFVANAASFVLPVSNPANLVVLGSKLPPLLPWLGSFALAAVAAVALTYWALRLLMGPVLATPLRSRVPDVSLDSRMRRAFILVGLAAAALTIGAGFGVDIGYVALAAAVVVILAFSLQDHQTFSNITKHFPWQILPLVAGLFVIVGAIDRTGGLAAAGHLFAWAEHAGRPWGVLALGTVLTAACTALNNLPVALAAGHVILSGPASSTLAHAALVGVDLGPNLSVSGSLATLLWVIVLRRDGIEVTPLQFLRLGVVVTVPALIAAMLLVR